MRKYIFLFSMIPVLMACGMSDSNDIDNDRYIVVTNNSYLKSLYGDEYNENGQSNTNEYTCIGGRCYYVVNEADAQRLLDEGNAISIEKDIFYVIDNPYEEEALYVASIGTNDTYLSSQWSLSDSIIGWEDAGSVFQAIDSSDIIYSAAVIDTGFSVHEDRNDYECYDIFEKDKANITQCRDEFGHGSHVAGIIAADTNNSLGIASSSYGKTGIFSVRASQYDGRFYSYDVLRALGAIYYRCKNEDYKISAVNMSFGGSSPMSAHYEIIQDLLDMDIAVVVAAGNDGVNLTNMQEYPANYNLNNIVTVASLSSSYSGVSLSYYSNYGGATDIAAPGGSILSFGMFGRDYVVKSGTSMAAPFITGLLAAGKNAAPNLTMGQLVNIMYATAYKSSDLIGKVRDGNVVDAGAFMQKIAECKDTGCTGYDKDFPARIYINSPNSGINGGCSIGKGSNFSLTFFAIAALALRRFVRRKTV